MTEFSHTLRELLQAAIADMERISEERHKRKGVLTGKSNLSESTGPGGAGTSEHGGLVEAPRPTSEDP